MIALLIDIGNSRVKWRIGRSDAAWVWLTDGQSIASNASRDIADLLARHADLAVDAVLVSNVAGEDVEALVRDGASTVWRDAAIHRLYSMARQGGVVNGYRDPARLGPDRWLAMIGAHARRPDESLLVCSFGTATTIDLLVTPERGDARFVGGLILPGFDAMRASLAVSTARLPLADGRMLDFGVDTDDAITSGIAAAQAGAVERAWGKAKALVPAGRSVRCMLAGGAAPTVASLLGDHGIAIDVAPDLVLHGMATIACAVVGTSVTAG